MRKRLAITGLALSLVATIFLYLGSRKLPWEISSASGKTEREISFYNGRKIETTTGFVFLFGGFSLQLFGAIKEI